MNFHWGAETQFLQAGSVRDAWRHLGAPEGVPLLLLQLSSTRARVACR